MRLGIKHIGLIGTTLFAILILIFGHFLFFLFYIPTLSENHDKVDTQLYLGNSDNQPLIVLFGGGEGGNIWTEECRSDLRRRFLDQGYAILSVGYFGTETTPLTLDRISLNAIYKKIKDISNHPGIDKERIALLGTSRGAELALNLASRYDDFNAVVAIVPSHATFSAITFTANTSAWTFNGSEIPHFKVPYKALLLSVLGDPQKSWEIMMENEQSETNSIIKVEKINGPILLISAKQDQTWPSDYMANKIIKRLEKSQFKHYYNHFSFDGGHNDSMKHFDVIFEFMAEYFRPSPNKELPHH